jgi:hypothetical protein
MNKKLVIISTLGIITIGAGIYLGQLFQQKPIVKTVVVSERPALPPPVYTTQPEYKVEATTSFPKNIDAYLSIGTPSAKTLASTIVTVINIGGTPQYIRSTTGDIYMWNGINNDSVIASEGLSHIAYASTPGTNKKLEGPLESYYSAAEQFLVPFNLTKEPVRLVRTSPRYFNPSNGDANETTSMIEATSVELRFQYAINSIPIYFGSASGPSVTVRLDANKKIISVSAYIIPVFTKTTTDNQIVLSQEAVARLNNNEGRITDLVSSDKGDQPYYFDSPPTVVDVVNVDLAYYYSPSQKTLVPVFAFKGTGSVGGKTVETTTLVSAVK